MDLLTIMIIKILLILLRIKLIFTVSENEVKMIVDVVNWYEKPTDVVVNVCWRKSMKIDLINKLGKLKNPKRVTCIQKNEICEDIPWSNNVMIVIDSRCSNINDILFNANACKKIKNPYRWLIIGSTLDQHHEKIPEFKNYNILTDTEIILSQKFESIFKLYMPYKIGPKNKKWIFENFGTWDPDYELNTSKDLSTTTSIRRKDLLGEPIAISVVITDNRTRSELLEMRNIHRDSLAKVSFLQFLPIYDFINATKVVIYTETWGYSLNGTWNGMIGTIARGEAELAGTVVFINEERFPVLEYMNFPSSTSVKFVFREPPLSYQSNLFLLPFKPIVWCCIIGLVFVLIFILYINAQWESVKSTKDNEFDHTILEPNVSDITIMVISAISQQGSTMELKGTLGRVVMLILFLAFVFLYTSYSASIVALLQSSSNRIRTLSDLLNSGLELGSQDTVYNRHYFSTATEPVKKAIYQSKIAPRGSKPNFMELKEGVHKLQKEPFAFNMNTGSGYRLVEQYFYEHEKCGLREIAYLSNNKPWQSCRKESPYKEILKIGSFRNQEHGFNVRANKIVYSKKPLCIAGGGSFGSVNMMDFYPALLTLLYGMILAVIILLFEIFLHRKQCQIRMSH